MYGFHGLESVVCCCLKINHCYDCQLPGLFTYFCISLLDSLYRTIIKQIYLLYVLRYVLLFVANLDMAVLSSILLSASLYQGIILVSMAQDFLATTSYGNGKLLLSSIQ